MNLKIEEYLNLRSLEELVIIAKGLEIPISRNLTKEEIKSLILKSGEEERLKEIIINDTFFDNNISYFFHLLHKLNLKNIFLILLVFIVLINSIRFFQASFSNTLYYFLNSIFEAFLVLLSLWLLHMSRRFIVPKIRSAKQNIRRGDIWYIRKIKIDPSSSSDLKLIKLLNFAYVSIRSVMAILLFILFYQALFFWLLPIIALILSFIGDFNTNYFAITLVLWIFAINLCYLFSEIVFASLLRKKYVYLYLYNGFVRVKFNENKLLYFINIILPFLKNYSLERAPETNKYISKNLMKQICGYYSLIATSLIKPKQLFDNWYPELHSAILKEDYEKLLKHLNKLHSYCLKLDGYTSHTALLKTYNKNIGDIECIQNSTELGKIKWKWWSISTEDVVLFLITNKIGQTVIILLMLFIFAKLAGVNFINLIT